MKILTMRFGSMMAALALMLTAVDVNSACRIVMHQPKLPEGAERFKKC